MLGAFSPSATNGDKRDAWLAHTQGQQLLYASPSKNGTVKTPVNGTTNFNSQSQVHKSLQQTFGNPLVDNSTYNSLPNGLNGAVAPWQSAQQLQRSGMDEAYSPREDSMLAHIQNRFASGHQPLPRTDGLTGHVTVIDSNLTSSSQATVTSPTLNLPVPQSSFPDRSWPSDSPVLEFPESLSTEDGVGNWNMELEAMLDSCDKLPPSLPRRASFGLSAEPERASGSQFIMNRDANCSVTEPLVPPTASRRIATGKLPMPNGLVPTAPGLKIGNGQMAKPPPPQQKAKKAASSKPKSSSAEIQQRVKEREHLKQVQQIRRTRKSAADKKARFYRKIKEAAQKALKDCEQLEELANTVDQLRKREEALKNAIGAKRLLDHKYQEAVKNQRELQTKAEHAREMVKMAEDATEGTIEYEYVEREKVHWAPEDHVMRTPQISSRAAALGTYWFAQAGRSADQAADAERHLVGSRDDSSHEKDASLLGGSAVDSSGRHQNAGKACGNAAKAFGRAAPRKFCPYTLMSRKPVPASRSTVRLSMQRVTGGGVDK